MHSPEGLIAGTQGMVNISVGISILNQCYCWIEINSWEMRLVLRSTALGLALSNLYIWVDYSWRSISDGILFAFFPLFTLCDPFQSWLCLGMSSP